MGINRFRKLLCHLFRNLKHRLVHIRFYSRLMIYYTLIFLFVVYAFAFVATKHYTKYTTLKQLEESKEALNAVCNYYEQKHTELSDIILPLFITSKSNLYIDSVLSSPTDEEYNNPLSRMEIFEVLQDIAQFDGDIEEILLYKNINGSRFVYRKKDRTFQIVDQDYPFFDIMAEYEHGRIVTGTRRVGSNPAVKNKNVYGLGGILGLDDDTGIKGKFLIAYNTEAISSVFRSYSGDRGRFILASLNGDIIFDSEGGYSGENFTYIDVLLSGESHTSIDGRNYYIQTIEGKKASYIGANIVPEEALDEDSNSVLIFSTFTLMAIICIILYMVGGQFIFRRVKEIEQAMNYVELNNLSYRIPISKQSDEFGRIAVKFNEMCDELQKTIDLEYISEIKKRNAQLESLQKGINPHFLYNTLEVIRVRAVDTGNDDVANMIVNLANLYRAMVKNCTFIPIRNEINICEIYVDTFSYHYEKTLDCEIDIESEVLKYGIPKNLLHPVIENYFVHGIKNDGGDNHFVIHGYLINKDIYFVFEDNGRGISQKQLDKIRCNIEASEHETGSGYGLINVQKRIRLIYGENYGISLESEENSMTRITVQIKAMTCDELEASLKFLS